MYDVCVCCVCVVYVGYAASNVVQPVPTGAALPKQWDRTRQGGVEREIANVIRLAEYGNHGATVSNK